MLWTGQGGVFVVAMNCSRPTQTSPNRHSGPEPAEGRKNPGPAGYGEAGTRQRTQNPIDESARGAGSSNSAPTSRHPDVPRKDGWRSGQHAIRTPCGSTQEDIPQLPAHASFFV